MDLPRKVTDRLKDIKQKIETSHSYFSDNYKRFHEFRNFVFRTSLSSQEMAILQELNKPIMEFNILNAYISRLCGEFSKQEPSISVSADYDMDFNPDVMQVVEGHIRHILCEATKDSAQYQVYKDTLSGGFSAFKVWTEYAHAMSFDQVIRFGRVYEPTLCGWDPLARLPHKGDGMYCFECYPRTIDEFKTDYPDHDISKFKFNRNIEGFSWSYSTEKDDIVILCDYYEKKIKRKRIAKLSNGQVMEVNKYNDLIEMWTQRGIIEQPPVIVGEPRWTDIETICRYVLVENGIISYEETDYAYLPIVFVDGDSVMLRVSNTAGAYTQFTRPYVYHAKDTQRLKNFAGQTLANEIENMVMHKFKVAKESLPAEPEYLHAYTDVQKARVLVYNAYDPNNTGKQLPAPTEIPRVGTPPEVTNAFAVSDQVIQNVLGSYDAALGINQNQLSGVAIVEAATQSNAAAMPYIVHYMQSLNQVAQIILDLIPKYYVTPRTIPVVDDEGKRHYVNISPNPQQNSNAMQLQYTPAALQIKVEAGVNFNIQKDKALQQILALSQASPLFSQFINAEGLPIILDNMDIRGIDALKKKAEVWTQQQSQLAQQQMQQQMQQPDPNALIMQLEQAKLAEKAQADQRKAEIEAAKVGIDKQNADTNRMKVMAEMGQEMDRIEMQKMRSEAETVRAEVDLAIKHAEFQHKMIKE